MSLLSKSHVPASKKKLRLVNFLFVLSFAAPFSAQSQPSNSQSFLGSIKSFFSPVKKMFAGVKDEKGYDVQNLDEDFTPFKNTSSEKSLKNLNISIHHARPFIYPTRSYMHGLMASILKNFFTQKSDKSWIWKILSGVSKVNFWIASQNNNSTPLSQKEITYYAQNCPKKVNGSSIDMITVYTPLAASFGFSKLWDRLTDSNAWSNLGWMTALRLMAERAFGSQSQHRIVFDLSSIPTDMARNNPMSFVSRFFWDENLYIQDTEANRKIIEEKILQPEIQISIARYLNASKGSPKNISIAESLWCLEEIERLKKIAEMRLFKINPS